MKIKSLNVSNFCGVRAVNLAMTQPVTLICGSNAAGKTGLQDAIRLALTANLGRISLKKDAGALVRDGADSAKIQLSTDAAEIGITIGKGGKMMLPDISASPVLPYLLDMNLFARADANTRRTLLASITNTAPTPELIVKRLLALGCESDKVEAIKPLLRAGVGSACSHAKQQATEAKGAWRAVTGETYGEVKAADWKAEFSPVDTDAESRLNNELEQTDTLLADNQAQLGALENRLRDAVAIEQRREYLRGSADKVGRIKAKLAVDEAEEAKWQLKLEEVQAAAAGVAKPKLFDCPCCTAKLYHRTADGALLEWKEPEQVASPTAAAQLPEIQRSLNIYKTAVMNDKRDLADAEKFALLFAELPDPVDVQLVNANITALQKRIVGLRTDRKAIDENLRQVRADMRAAAESTSKTGKASGYHADVVAWTKIADALSPDGIPGELLTGALKAINSRLRQSADDTGWKQVLIDADMNITADGRIYALLSESEQWRVNAVITEMISFISGVKMMALDRMDVLDTAGRGDCMSWLSVLAESAEIDHAIVCATLKAAPTSRAGLDVFWLEDGQVVQPMSQAA